MSIAAIVRALVSAGATPEMILAAVEAAEVAQGDGLSARRKADAERQKRFREKNNVTSRYANVSHSDNPAPLDVPPLSPPAPPLSPPLNPPTPDADDGARGGVDLDALSARLTEAAGSALHVVSPALMSLADPLRWLREGCDLDADVLPAVRIAAARSPPGRVKSWAYFTDAVADARNKRLSPMPATTYIHRGQDHGKTRLAQAVDRLRADVRAASSGDRG